jgi:uncharacterized membrane protein
MPWYIYSAASAILFTGMVLIVRKLGNKGFSSKQILTFLLGFALIGFLLLNGSKLFQISNAENFSTFLVVVIISSVFYTIGNFADFTAMIKSPNPGYATATKSSNVILITLLSVLIFGSSLTWSKLLGAIIVMAGVILLVIDRKAVKNVGIGKGLNDWRILAAVAAVSFALAVLGQKWALRIGFSSAQINLFIFALTFLSFLVWSRKDIKGWISDKVSLKFFLPLVFFAGAFSCLANYFSVIGVGQAPNPGYSESIKYTQNLFIVFLAVPLLGAKFNKQKFLGVVTVLVGAVIVVLL